jgi:hypothetical protein
MVREDLINSAVSPPSHAIKVQHANIFRLPVRSTRHSKPENLLKDHAVLQDPSVAQAPLDKKIAFLQSKNLTPEEVDVSLARVGDPPASSVGSVPPNYAYRQPPPPQAGYGAYPGGYYAQPPPELPKRDWRDWFIMATVMGGVGYGIYFTAKVGTLNRCC